MRKLVAGSVRNVTVVDAQMGNIGSLTTMIAKVGGVAHVTSDPALVRNSEKLILAGVGHFDRGMASLDALGLTPVLTEIALERHVPILGICLGMQLMCRSSEEGTRPGLGWINAEVRRLDPQADSDRVKPGPPFKVPHMGWNTTTALKESPLFDSATLAPQRFYFVHSFYVACSDPGDVLTTTTYNQTFCSSFLRENLIGVQFHPEKSHSFGMDLFRRFVEL